MGWLIHQVSFPQDIEYMDPKSAAQQTMIQNGNDELSHFMLKTDSCLGLN